MNDDDTRTRSQSGALLTGLVVLAVVVVGLPQVWTDLRNGGIGLESVFYPVLAVAFGYLSLSRRPQR